MSAAPAAARSDDFEDDAIDRGKWAVGGEARGWQPQAPIGDGDWSTSHEELAGSPDGYLSLRVWGPTSANTYGAEAWVRTRYNFNDGRSHLVNFKWEAKPALGGHDDYYFIQVTDGFIPWQGDVHWPMRRPPQPPITEAALSGTADLLCSATPGQSLPDGYGPKSMSLQIRPEGTAQLYDGPGKKGLVLRAVTLDKTKPWYLRFMVSDATSVGFLGKVVLLDFWATWCPPCVKSIPRLEMLYQKHKGEGLVVLGLNDERDHAKVKAFAENRISYVVLLDADRSFSEYGIEAVPTLIYVDKEGKARGCDLGFAEGKETEIERKIKELLGP